MDELARLMRARSLAADGTGRAQRLRARLSAQEVAEALGVDVATLHRWETGASRPRRDAALRWLKAMEQLSPTALTEPAAGQGSHQ